MFRNIESKLLLTLCAVALVVMLSITVVFVAQYTEERLAIEDSRAFSSMILDVQSFYAKTIVSHAKKNNIKVAKDFKKSGTAIPFPATFTHLFIRELNKKYKDLSFHFYSDYPFYRRVGGGPRDLFERDALKHFRTSKDNTIHAIENSSEKRVLRFARAIRMEKSCVDCHNSHPDSPHKNWKLGDVRGVHSLKIKLPGFSFMKNDHLNPLIITIATLYIFVAFLVFLLFYAVNKLRQEREQRKIIKDQNMQLETAKSTIAESEYIDLVTNLPNRKQFYEFVNKKALIENEIKYFSIVIIDINHFKHINDRYGHTMGDRLLKSVGIRLKELISELDMVARIGADEFAIYCHNLVKPEDLSKFIAKIFNGFKDLIQIEGSLIEVDTNIGISCYPDHGKSADVILSNASIALNKAKNDGAQNYCIFDKNMEQKARQDDILETDLKTAITNNELDIFYQPKVSLKTGEINGFEALIRWPHANQGFISPEDFLPIAEERGLIIPVSHYVAQRVAFDMATWLDKKMLRGRIAINIHSHQLKNLDEMEYLINIFDEYDIPPEYLTLEITEGCVMGKDAEQSIGILEHLSTKGIKISLDDFGTGYASLTHLKELPVQEVKIDKSFLADITSNKESEAIVYAIIDLARKIGLDVVAEGIETQEQLQKLKLMGCDTGQGFLFSPPSMMIVANGLLSLPNLFKDIVLEDQKRPVFPYKVISKEH